MIMKKKYIFTILVFVSAFFCLSVSGCSRMAVPNKPLDYEIYSPPGTISGEGQYIIGLRDELEVLIWRCPELDSEVTVRAEDGNITLPLIGDVKAEGKTPRQLAEVIGKKMARFVKEPRIAVGVKKFGEKKVILLGEVMGPGAYRVERGDRIIDLISRAGGFTEYAIPSATYVVRGGYEKAEVIRVNMGRLIHEADLSQNIYLMENDIVVVPESEIQNYNFALQQLFPSFYFADRVANLRNTIMDRGFDWHEVFKRGTKGF